jgi:hypothetical protein
MKGSEPEYQRDVVGVGLQRVKSWRISVWDRGMVFAILSWNAKKKNRLVFWRTTMRKRNFVIHPSIHPSIYAAFFPNSLFNAHSRISIECHPSSLLFSFSTSIDVPLPLLLSFNLLYE